MAHRTRRQRSLQDQSDRQEPNCMDQLTQKYMEMCRVTSSTDSDSEISARWSDTSTMGCVSSAPESETSQQSVQLTQKPGSYSESLDPYDGSSEDSDESHIDVGVSSRQTRQQGKGCRLLSRSRRFILHHPASIAFRDAVKNGMRDSATEKQRLMDVQMKSKSDSELLACGPDTLPSHGDLDGCRNLTEERIIDSTAQTMNVELQLDDSGLHATRSSSSHTPVNESPSQVLTSSSDRFPSFLSKRKLALPGAEEVEFYQRKRQCLVGMEEGKTSASEAL
ncbi:uncharacterized protein LOC111573337 isoform X2 [Amphiprion ocellaris]|uniref:uncharacterized protein LOC111573337 isoform X2 n=1 Tax=Amphiprion ocellaris TaxID=80972 RepID=UPI000C2FF878|nr:uncharacterized protein LOC111573337 isoform X2 [Amphiprion ocellaris]